MMAAGAQVLRLLVSAIGAIFRPKTLLIAEKLCLRQQLAVLQRRHPRPSLSDADRRFWILASRWFSDWRNPLLIVKPETVLGWQRAGWKAYWRWRSSRQARGGRPVIRGELQALIGRMAAENRLWGQKRIQAELARLGFQVSARTVANICECAATEAQPGRGESS
jgi:putative transposase